MGVEHLGLQTHTPWAWPWAWIMCDADDCVPPQELADDNATVTVLGLEQSMEAFGFDLEALESNRAAAAAVLCGLLMGLAAFVVTLAVRGRRRPSPFVLVPPATQQQAQQKWPAHQSREEAAPIVSVHTNHCPSQTPHSYSTFASGCRAREEDAAWTAALAQWHAALEKSRELSLPTPERPMHGHVRFPCNADGL